MSEPPQEEMKDNAVIQEFMTAYLYGMYTLKGGHFKPSEAIDAMLGFANMAEKAAATGKSLMSWFSSGDR